MIHLDTSVLIDALTGPKRAAPHLRAVIARGERILICTLVLYEWLRGPRHAEELALQDALFPPDGVVPFGAEEATLAADLYRRVTRGRGRELDLAVAACALRHEAALWTLNPRDFRDVPGLTLFALN